MMAGLDPRWLFGATAAALVVVAMLFVLPRAWWRSPAARGPMSASRGVATGPTERGHWRGRAALWAGLPVLAGALYWALGDPDALDPQRGGLSAQLRQAETPLVGPTADQVQAELAQHLLRQPDDPRALVLQARLDLQAQRYPQAVAGFERALKGPSKAAGDAGVWVEYAEAVGLQQAGRLAGRPRQLVDKALALNPDHPQALDLAGSAAWEAGEFTLAARHWQRLLAQLPAGSPRHVQLAAAISRAERRGRFALPAAR
jgi:cytochrome c-type biogenesis protein CcmH